VLRLVALFVLLAGPLAAQESVVTGLSTSNIALTADFNGSELLVFGAIRRDGPVAPDAAPLDIIITIKGPEGPVTVRRKERRFGIWVNTEAVRIRQAPSFYAIATTRPLADLLTETERLRWGIGMDQAVRRIGGAETIEDTGDFATAVVRLRQADGTYAQLDEAVTLTEDILFQTQFAMPANLVEGDYAAQFFLVRDREVISAGSTTITVEKAGIERWLYNLSRNEPLLYGLGSVLVALAAGWLAAEAFRLARR
jgi:uncharacterized protein (TIGR02186 family)